MNEETKHIVEDKKFEELFESLHEKHKPIKPKIDERKLAAIGLVIVRFQGLEFTIRWFIGMLSNICNDQPLVNIQTVKYSFKNLVLVLSALAKEKGFHRIDDLEFLIKKCYSVEQIRNQLIHSVWTTGPRMKSDLSSKRGLQHKSENFSCEELEAIAETIKKLDTSMSAIEHDYIQHCIDSGETPNGVRVVK